MKSFVIFAIIAIFASASLAQDHTQSQTPLDAPPQGWYKQQSGNTDILDAIFFLNRDTGWISSAHGVYGTMNAGDTWTLLTTQEIGSQFFIDANNGIGFTGHIVKTVDGGKSWTQQGVQSPVGGQMQIFSFDTIRIFNGSTPAFAGSNDGGKTWFSDDTSETMVHAQQGGMSFANSRLGFLGGRTVLWFDPPPPAEGTNGAGFAFTTDGGKTWHPKYCSVQDGFQVISAPDAKHIYTAGINIYSSSDGGNTWATGPTIGGVVTKFNFLNVGRGYTVGGAGRIYFTSDTGRTWTRQNSTVTSDLQDIFFIDTLNGWACGNQGTILHTTNAGKSWVRQNLPTPLKIEISPDPFGTHATARYSLPTAEHVSIGIYDVTGKVIQRIIENEYQDSGEHSVEIDGSRLRESTYYLRMDAGTMTGFGKMTKIAP